MDDENGGRSAVLVGGRHIDKDLSLSSHRLLRRFQSAIGPGKDFAVGQSHAELEVLSLGVAAVGEIRVDLVFGTDDVIAVSICAWTFGVGFGCPGRGDKKAEEANKAKDSCDG